jgi:nitronate monooxygenase
MIPSIVNQGLDPKEVVKQEAKMNFNGQDGSGVKPWKGIWAAGQGVGCVDEVLSTANLVGRLESEYLQAKRNTKL